MSYIALFSRRSRLRAQMTRLAGQARLDLVSCVNAEPLVWQDALVVLTDLPMARRLVRAEVPPRHNGESTVLVATWDETGQPFTPVWDLAERLGCRHVTVQGTATDDWYVDHFIRTAATLPSTHR